MRILTTMFCLLLFSTSILAEESFKLNTSKTKSFQLTTSLKNEYSLETLPKTLDTSNRQELSHIIPSNILASVSYTIKKVSMGSGDQFSREVSQTNCDQIACSRATARQRQRARQAACSQNSNGQWFFGKRLIQNRNTRCANGSCF